MAGFERIEARDGAKFWQLDLVQQEVLTPSWIKVES